MVALRACEPVSRGKWVGIPLPLPNDGSVCTTKPGRRFVQSIEHGVQVEGRAADDLENVARRSLIFERLLQLARASLHLLEKSGILDRDYRLVGEGL